jgi:hypothetical protein
MIRKPTIPLLVAVMCLLGIGVGSASAGKPTTAPARAPSSSALAPPAAAGLEPASLPRARMIRAQVDARYRSLPGRRLAVREATSMGVFESVTLWDDLSQLPRVVPADNGIYFAICRARARCAYPGRSASWPAAAVLPLQQALELALRTFLETSANLVVVSLPTAQPVWAIFERDEFLASIDAPAVLDQLARTPGGLDRSQQAALIRLARPRLYRPIPLLPPTRETILAVTLSAP